MLVLTIVFSRIAKLPSDGNAPYALMVFAAMLPWQFFATALSESGNSLITNANLISKIYFPRLIVPASSVITSFVDFLISAAFLVLHDGLVSLRARLAARRAAGLHGAGLRRRVGAGPLALRPERQIPRFPLHRALRCAVRPVCIAGGLSSTIIPQNMALLYSLNPMVGVIDGFRWAILGGQGKLSRPSLAAATPSADQLAAAGATLYWPGLAASVIIVLGLCVTGVWYFRRTERTFADVI